MQTKFMLLSGQHCRSFGYMQIGDVAEGVIQSIKPYGAFVDLGKGMSGLLHISQISFDRITNVGSILSEGDKLKVCVRWHLVSHKAALNISFAA